MHSCAPATSRSVFGAVIMMPQAGHPQTVPHDSGALVIVSGYPLQSLTPTAAYIASDAQYTHAHAHHYTNPPTYAEPQPGETADHHSSGVDCGDGAHGYGQSAAASAGVEAGPRVSLAPTNLIALVCASITVDSYCIEFMLVNECTLDATSSAWRLAAHLAGRPAGGGRSTNRHAKKGNDARR
jgi:hypothetical protein